MKFCNSLLLQLKSQLEKEDKLIFQAKITPNAPKNEIFGILDDGTVKIRITSVPEKGKANKMLIKFLEKSFGAKVEILIGAMGRVKKIKVFK